MAGTRISDGVLTAIGVNDKIPFGNGVGKTVTTPAALLALSGNVNMRAAFDASINTYPASGGSGPAGAILAGNIFPVSVIGTPSAGVGQVGVGTLLIALVDSPGQTDSKWRAI